MVQPLGYPALQIDFKFGVANRFHGSDRAQEHAYRWVDHGRGGFLHGWFRGAGSRRYRLRRQPIISTLWSVVSTMEIAFIFALLILAVILFVTERVSVDVITLLLLAALTVTGILTPREAFAGFSSDMMVILGSIFIIGGALQRSGLLETGVSLLLKCAKAGPRSVTVLMMLVSAGCSTFMNNTTVTALFVAPVAALARSTGVSPSKLLMPLAFASILGGTCTLIGTSTNIAVSGYLATAGMKPIGLFELTPIGLIIVAVGTIYCALLSGRLLPDVPDEMALPPESVRNYLCEVLVLPGSRLIGHSAFAWNLNLQGYRLVRLVRHGEEYLPETDLLIEAGDTLIVQGSVAKLLKVMTREGLEFKARLEPEEVTEQHGDIRVAEAVLLPDCNLAGQTLREADLRRTSGLMVLAISRHGQSMVRNMAEVQLRAGDLLLVQGPVERINALRGQIGFGVIDQYEPPVLRRWQGLLSSVLFLSAVVLGGTGVLPLSAALLSAAVLIILCGGLAADQAREVIDWRLLILIGGMTAFGTAMEKTGAAELLANGIVAGLEPFGAQAVLAGFFLLTVILTQPMSNAAAALVVMPVALNAAAQVGADPRTFAIGVMLAASVSFIAPLEPSCVLVYAPGRYKFMDFVKFGGGLTLVLLLVVLPLVSVFWPLR